MPNWQRVATRFGEVKINECESHCSMLCVYESVSLVVGESLSDCT
jgi:hypothetical protein